MHSIAPEWTANDRILVFAGSISDRSSNRHLARNVANAAADLGIVATHLDLREYPLPLYDRDLVRIVGIPRHAMALRSQLKRHPVWLIASPEHNGSVSAVLKNAIDWASCAVIGEGDARFERTKVGLLSSSREPDAQTLSLVHLRQILKRLGAHVLDSEFVIAGGGDAFDSMGRLRNDADRAALRNFVQYVHLALTREPPPRTALPFLRNTASRWLLPEK